jgi:hypothetical protein
MVMSENLRQSFARSGATVERDQQKWKPVLRPIAL